MNEIAFIKKYNSQNLSQIEILQESTKMNLIKRQTMKNQLYENYWSVKSIK
jgi:hypothetical protein